MRIRRASERALHADVLVAPFGTGVVVGGAHGEAHRLVERERLVVQRTRVEAHGAIPGPPRGLDERFAKRPAHATPSRARADEEAFQFLKSLHARDRIIPAVGDLGGTTAMTAVARFLRSEKLTASAFYTSNVEFYLRGSQFTQFVQNVRQMPWAPNAVIIRSRFSGGASASEIERVATFLKR